MFNLSNQIYPTYETNKALVTSKQDAFIPLLNKDEINRNTFFHLRKQLITLGCPENSVLQIAQKLCMDVLNYSSVEDYLQYILNDTFEKCESTIKNGYNPFPIQNPQNSKYSHTSLFSSIYGYEINYLLSKSIAENIADIGCGDGLFIKLAEKNNLKIHGYDIKIPIAYHTVPINKIEHFSDIRIAYDCIILNHVLEHIEVRPDKYLLLIIEFFKKKYQKRLNKILISLPTHHDIKSHQACNHFWMCSKHGKGDRIVHKDKSNTIRTFDPFKAFEKIAQKYKYKLLINWQIGLFIFE